MQGDSKRQTEGTGLEELSARVERWEDLLKSFQYALNTLVYLTFDDIDALLDTVISLGCTAFKAQGGAVLYRGEDGAYTVRAMTGLEGDRSRSYEDGFVAAAKDARETQIVNRWADRPDWEALARPDFVTPPFAVTTVDIHDVPEAILYFSRTDETREFKQDEAAYFKVFSGVAATALSNCQGMLRAQELNRQIQEQRDELEATNRTLAQRAEEMQDKIETIEYQQEEISRLGTPVVNIWEGILCMPLIGVLDSQRAQQAMEVLLSAIIDEKARLVILDITGVPLVDSLVANYLAQTMAAVKLIGAEGILTGISAGVAQTLVKLGVDASGLTTRATLAEGLQQALKRMGTEIVTAT